MVFSQCFFYSASLFFFIIVKSQNESNKLNFEIKQIINGQSKLPNMELILTAKGLAGALFLDLDLDYDLKKIETH